MDILTRPGIRIPLTVGSPQYSYISGDDYEPHSFCQTQIEPLRRPNVPDTICAACRIGTPASLGYGTHSFHDRQHTAAYDRRVHTRSDCDGGSLDGNGTVT